MHDVGTVFSQVRFPSLRAVAKSRLAEPQIKQCDQPDRKLKAVFIEDGHASRG